MTDERARDAERLTEVQQAIERSPVHKQANPFGAPVFVLLAFAVVIGLMAVVQWGSIARDVRTVDRTQPTRVTACEQADYDEETGCRFDAFVDPDRSGDPVLLTPDFNVAVVGDVIQEAPVDIAYEVEVFWVALDPTPISSPGERFVVLSTPITWESDREAFYEVEWEMPTRLFERALTVQPGTDLGRWRLVGSAVPVRSDIYDTYQWDSVKTFRMVQGDWSATDLEK